MKPAMDEFQRRIFAMGRMSLALERAAKTRRAVEKDKVHRWAAAAWGERFHDRAGYGVAPQHRASDVGEKKPAHRERA
jgi:hypothetical protein